MPAWLFYLANSLEIITAQLIIIYLITCLFDFEELLDFSVINKDDLPVKLTDQEIDEIGKEIKQEMNMTEQLSLTLK